MTILKRYILKELFGPTLLGLLFFTFLLFITRIFRLADILLSEGVDPVLVGKFALCLFPSLLSFTIPCAVLVGVLISFGRLASDNEILAIRTSGIHILTVFKPVVITGLILSLAMFAINYSLVPNLNFRSLDYLYQIEFQLFNTLRPGRFYDELESGDVDITFYFGSRDPYSTDMLNIHMKLVSKMSEITGEKDESSKRKKETILLAEKGRIIADNDSRMIRLQLYNGSLHPLDRRNPAQNNMMFFKELTRSFNPTLDKMKETLSRKKNKDMTLPELVEQLRQGRGLKNRRYNKARVALLQRFSNPLACLTFILIGMPLAIYVRPSGKSVGYALSFGLLFLYYLLMKWGSSLGDVGHPLAPLAIFSPNIVLGSIGSILIFLQSLK
ncbi:LptF/LptG family permease [Candidatus Sumerlaeota bacterium]|nr:LptF/LptG family permease [Candidatus Sumerlaeota bacterium]